MKEIQNLEQTRSVRTKRLRRMSAVFVAMAAGCSAGACLWLPMAQREAFYMISAMFVFMAAFCFLGKPKA